MVDTHVRGIGDREQGPGTTGQPTPGTTLKNLHHVAAGCSRLQLSGCRAVGSSNANSCHNSSTQNSPSEQKAKPTKRSTEHPKQLPYY